MVGSGLAEDLVDEAETLLEAEALVLDLGVDEALTDDFEADEALTDDFEVDEALAEI